MTTVTSGDLAQHFTLRRHTANLQEQVTDRLKELGSGQAADITRHVTGDFTALSALERSLDLNRSYASVLDSSQTFLSGQALAFDQARASLAQTGLALVDAAESVDQTRRRAVLAEGAAGFDTAVSALSAQSGGRSLFAGAATQSAAFAPPQAILTAFAADVASATTASDVMAVADSWFGLGGSYETVAYRGAASTLAGFRVGETETIVPELSGLDDNIRELLKLHALAGVMGNNALSLNDAELSNLMASVGTKMLNLDHGMIEQRASIGALETRLDQLSAANEAEAFSLQEARQDLVGVDTAETVMRLTELETRLEALYSMTARVSRLSLSEFLR